MSNVIGSGVIQVSADTTTLRASINDAKASIASLGTAQADATASSATSINKYIAALGVQNQMVGKTTDQAKLLALGLKGASDAQLQVAATALTMTATHKEWIAVVEEGKTAMLALGAAAIAGLGAAAVGFNDLVKSAAAYQEMSVKIGDSAQAVASLAVAAAAGNITMDQVTQASEKLSKGMAGVTDATKPAGAALIALGINIADFKNLSPTDQLIAVSQSMAGFADGTGKTAAAMALFGKAGADMLPMLKELADGVGTQTILTNTQIAAAAAYAAQQRVLTAEISLQAESIALGLLPQIIALKTELLNMVSAGGQAKTISDALSEGFSIVLTVFKAVAIGAADLAFYLYTAGRGLGALVAAGTALVTLHPQDAFNIWRESIQSTVKAYNDLNTAETKVLALGTRPGAGIQSGRSSGAGAGTAGSQVPFAGAVKSTGNADASAALALDKANLAAQLEAIKAESAAELDVYANAAKILDAEHAAGLIADRAYYASKAAMAQGESLIQQQALTAEIAALKTMGDAIVADGALRKNTSANNDRTAALSLANDTKIAQDEAALAKLIADATASGSVADIQAAKLDSDRAAATKLLTDAQTVYLAKVQLKQVADLAAIGTGTQATAQAQAQAAIMADYATKIATVQAAMEKVRASGGLFGPDQQQMFNDQITQLKTFQQQALDQYAINYAAILAKQGDWVNGMNAALQNYATDAANTSKQVQGFFTDTFKGMEDAFVTFTQTGKISFTSLANSMLAELARIQFKAATAPITAALGPGGGGFAAILKALGIGGSTNPPETGGGTGDTGAFQGGTTAEGIDAVYSQGTNYVPTTGLALLHQGEAVVPAQFNNANSAQGNTASGAPPVTINVVNNGPPVSAQASTPRLDGKKYVIDVFLNTLRTDGNFRNSINAGLRPPA